MRHIDFSWGEPRPKANFPSNYHNSANLPKQNNFTSAFVLGTNQINKQTSYYNESNLPHDIHSNHTLFLDSVYRSIFWKWVSTNRMYIDTAQHQDAQERTFCLHTDIHDTTLSLLYAFLPTRSLTPHTHTHTHTHSPTSKHDLQHRLYKSKDYRTTQQWCHNINY